MIKKLKLNFKSLGKFENPRKLRIWPLIKTTLYGLICLIICSSLILYTDQILNVNPSLKKLTLP